ncbi:MAG: hypothetical protein OEZ05_10700, partial [Nitrospirota bacterium]|nr:hypothetical protein [Nitrospirota bacterium]
MNRLSFGILTLVLMTSSLAHSAELHIGEITVIGSGTAVPGTNATFQSFGVWSRPVSPPAIHDGYVVFWGKHLDPDNSQPVHGLFRYSQAGGIERLVDTNTIMPGKSEPFEDITEFFTNQGNVAFLGARYSEALFEGVYSVVNGAIEVVADPSVVLPGTGEPSGRFNHPIIEGDRIAFVTGLGIFQSHNGALESLVLWSDLIPGRTDTFQGFGNITFDHGALSFFALGPLLGTGNWYDRYEGIFTKTSSGLSTEADVLTPIPEGMGDFITFGAMYPCGGTTFGFSLCSSGPVSQNGQVVFGGWDSTGGNHGLYVSSQGTLTKVADYRTILPGDTGPGARFDQMAIDQGAVAFTAENPLTHRQGVYLWDGEEIHKIYDSMNEKVRIGPQGLHRNQLVFSVGSGYDSEAIHIVELVRPITIQAGKDSFLYRKKDNQNEGAHSALLIGRDRGPLRSVISFNLRGISAASVNQARLILELQEPVMGLGSAGQSLQVRPLSEGFDEGNGKSYGLFQKASESGSGPGVTWSCAVDGNIANKGVDCDVNWLGGDLIVGSVTDEV